MLENYGDVIRWRWKHPLQNMDEHTYEYNDVAKETTI
jgi:hypothetical protein